MGEWKQDRESKSLGERPAGQRKHRVQWYGGRPNEMAHKKRLQNIQQFSLTTLSPTPTDLPSGSHPSLQANISLDMW